MSKKYFSHNSSNGTASGKNGVSGTVRSNAVVGASAVVDAPTEEFFSPYHNSDTVAPSPYQNSDSNAPSLYQNSNSEAVSPYRNSFDDADEAAPTEPSTPILIARPAPAKTAESTAPLVIAREEKGETIPTPAPVILTLSSGTLQKNDVPELPQEKPAELTPQVLEPGEATPQRITFQMQQNDEFFTHLHTTVEYAALDASIRGSDLADASLFQTGRPVVLGVTSALAGEGKTTVALHLALDIARNNYKKVCLMDLSLNDNVLAKRVGAGSGLGLVDVLEGTSHTVPTLEASDVEGFSVLPGGRAPNNAARAARSPSVPELMAASREMFDVIVVDMPPVASGNALPLAPYMDGLIFVVRAGATPRDIVQDAMQRVDKHKVLGVVLNRATSSTPRWLRKRFGNW